MAFEGRVPNGYECMECGEIERTGKEDNSDDPCGQCGSRNTLDRMITDCDLGSDCADDSHDYGADWHVESVD